MSKGLRARFGMVAVVVFRGCRGPEAGALLAKSPAKGSRLEADLARGFTTVFLFESFKIQKWKAIWLRGCKFVKDRRPVFMS
jgi:hypothetical protein